MNKITLQIDGMKCGMCEAHINDLFRKNIKLKKIKSSHKSGCTIIRCIDSIDEERIREILEPSGYRLIGYKIETEA